MEEIKEETKKENQRKLSYEELEGIAHQLSEQNMKLHSMLNETNINNLFKRLEFLFKVIEFTHCFPEEFNTKCVKEIMEIMTVPDNVEQSE